MTSITGSTEPPPRIQTTVMEAKRSFQGGITSIAIGVLVLSCVAAAQEHLQSSAQAQTPPLSLDQVVSNLEQRNAQRAAALEQFESKRIYRMRYHGFFRDRDAEMVVKVRFVAPASKQFTILSQSGSKFVVDQVFKKLLQAEQEASSGDNLRASALCRNNYNFQLAGYEMTPEGGRYILTLFPKTRNKFLYRGKIWVDAQDFAVVRIEGQPSRNPSMWIAKTDFAHRYIKIDDFWLPAENRTETSIRLGGKSTLSIEYGDYKIIKVSARHVSDRARVENSLF